MTDIGNRPVSLPDQSMSVVQAVLVPGVLVVLNVAALVASMTTGREGCRVSAPLRWSREPSPEPQPLTSTPSGTVAGPGGA